MYESEMLVDGERWVGVCCVRVCVRVGPTMYVAELLVDGEPWVGVCVLYVCVYVWGQQCTCLRCWWMGNRGWLDVDEWVCWPCGRACECECVGGSSSDEKRSNPSNEVP